MTVNASTQGAAELWWGPHQGSFELVDGSELQFFEVNPGDDAHHFEHPHRPKGYIDLDYLTDNSSRETLMDMDLGMAAKPVEISIFIFLFCALFVVGFAGNLTVIVRIVRTNRLFQQIYGKDDTRSRRMTTQRYVLLLACVDLFVTAQIPILIPYLYSGEWLLGGFLCKLFWVVDNVNKILSIHILTAMAIERYFIVLNSVRTGTRGRIPRMATTIWLVGTVVAVLLLAPLLTFVDLDQMQIGSKMITTCVSPMPDHVYIAFLTYMFSLSYCVPAFVVTVCYGGLVRILKTRYTITTPVVRENGKTQLIHKVSKSILCVTAFHFVCWTPFWIVNFLPLYFDHEVLIQYGDAMMMAQMVTLTLPYVNCSFNWCFYVLLNKRLRKQIFRSSSSHASATFRHFTH